MTFLRADFSEATGEPNINSNYNTFENANKIKDEKLSSLKKEEDKILAENADIVSNKPY